MIKSEYLIRLLAVTVSSTMAVTPVTAFTEGGAEINADVTGDINVNGDITSGALGIDAKTYDSSHVREMMVRMVSKLKLIAASCILFVTAVISLCLNADRAYASEYDIKPMQGRTMYCVGDSITLAIGGDRDISGRHISFSDYLGQYSGATVINSSFEGVQIGDYGINNCIMQRLYCIPVDTSVIVFWAGVDDFIWGTPMNYGRYKNDVDFAFSYMKNAFPYTKIIIVTTFKNRSEAIRTDRGVTLEQYMQYQAEAASRYGFSVVDFYNMEFSPLKTPEYFADEIHPNDAGNRLIADILYKKILEFP